MSKNVTSNLMKIVDFCNLLITPFIAFMALIQARLGASRLPLSYKIWDYFGVIPMRYHYYQPVFNVHKLPDETWTEAKTMHGIDLNPQDQLALLQKFNYTSELENIPLDQPSESLDFFYNNPSFCSGDAEILYSMIRHFKPKNFIEIGSGFSTMMAKKALDKNRQEGKPAKHLSIEPYEIPWLEQLHLDKVVREKVEDTDSLVFKELEENDILFIDSSHVVRTGGDVVTEYLNILPNLRKGVLVHIHDIFLPYDYPREWIQKYRYFWTEQYILQAFLSYNSSFKVLLALNYLSFNYRDELAKACPIYASQEGRMLGSFWIQRVK
ncbi:MAG: class I SAM-dependent methyltransferase [Coleofasciculaceae cyanobacterium]